MALSGNTLKASLKTAILAELQAKFPPPALQAGELTAFAAAQDKLAEAIAFGDGPTTVTHITGSASVSVPGVQAGGSTASGTVS